MKRRRPGRLVAVVCAAVVLAAVTAEPARPAPAGTADDVFVIPCRPVVVDGRAECRWEVTEIPAGTRVVILDARRRTP